MPISSCLNFEGKFLYFQYFKVLLIYYQIVVLVLAQLCTLDSLTFVLSR